METRRLEYFLQVAQTGSYTEAAERMFTTQSNVSKQILALEKELGVTLFHRTARRAQLTEAGSALEPCARAMLAQQRALCQTLAPYREDKAPLRICAIPVMGRHGITDTIAAFHRAHPELDLQLIESESVDLLDELTAGRCDVAYMRLVEESSDRFEELCVMEDRFAAVLPASHPLAEKEKLALADLRGEAFLQLNEKTQMYQMVCGLCRQAGFEPRVLYTGGHIDNILDLVSRGMGVSILMEQAVRDPAGQGLVVVPLDVEHKSRLAFVRLRHSRPGRAAALFWQYLRRQYGN